MKLLKQLCTSTCGALLLSAALLPVNVLAQAPPTPVAPATPPPVGTTPPPVVGTPAAPAQATHPPATAQTVPAAAATPNPALPTVNTAAWQALEPVRQAIARRDYAAAQQALQQARQTIPNDPALAVYENLIRTGMAQPASGANSVVRTPIPGVTPLPVVQTPAPTPEPTPVATPMPAENEAAVSTSTSGGIMGQAQDLWKNDTVKYALYGVGALIVLLILWAIFRKSKTPAADQSEVETPVPGSLSAVGGFDNMSSDYTSTFGNNEGSTDFGMGNPETDFSAMNDTGAGGAALGGAAMGAAAAGAVPDFTTFGLDEDEEEKPKAKPTFTPRASAPQEDEGPLSLHDDEPTTILPETPLAAPTPAPAEPAEPTLAAPENTGGVSFESLGLEPPAAPAKPAAPPTNPTPTANASVNPGEVNLDDIFGNQGFPGAGAPAAESTTPPPAEDKNSQTLPTFVSTPGAENPEESVEIPGKGQRSTPADEQDHSISFDQLFGESNNEMPSVAARTPEPTAAHPPEAEAPQPAGEPSIEDALAATLGAMQAQEPGEPTAAPAGAAPAAGGETLDERTERMFGDQMQKARQAMAAQDWRQAVHVLSIASALHPENEEAKQMLRDARAEKRKAEESV